MRGDSGFIHPRSQKQMSVAALPAHQQDAAMDATDAATEKYPQQVVGGCGLHVCEMGGEWEVWLNTDDATFTGLCVDVGATREEAIARALRTLEAVVANLQGR